MKRKTRTAALLLAAAMILVTMPGCRGDSGTGDNTGAKVGISWDTAGSAGSEGPADNTAAGPDAMITLKIWTMAFNKSFPPGIQEDPVAKEITKRTGIIMDVTPANSFANYSDSFAAALASDDLPDIVNVPEQVGFKSRILSAGAALCLDDYLEYAPDIVSETPYRLEYSRAYESMDDRGASDGKLYWWKSSGDKTMDPLQVSVAPYLRYDLWEELGYPALDTMDDYIPVMQQMMKMEPVNIEGDKNYGVSAWFADAVHWNDWPLNAFFGAIEGDGTIETHVYMDQESQTLDSKVLNAGSFYWKALNWFNRAYRVGILDPECFSSRFDDYMLKMTAGNLFLGFVDWSVEQANTSFAKAGMPGKGFFQMPKPTIQAKYTTVYSHPQGSYTFFVSSKTKYPEKAMELLNFFTSYEGCELIYNGVKGLNWEEADGKPVISEATLKAIAEDPDFLLKSGVNKYERLAGRGQTVMDPSYGTPVYFRYMPEYTAQRMTPLMKKAVKHFGINLPGDLYYNNPAITSKDYDTSLLSMVSIQKGTIKKTDNELYEYIQANQLKLIMAKTEADFSSGKLKFIEDCRRLGAEATLDWARKELQKKRVAMKSNYLN